MRKIKKQRGVADESADLEPSARRASMRQSIAPGELPLSDFLWLSNVRFAEAQPVPIEGLPQEAQQWSSSLAAAEADSLQQELLMLEQQFGDLTTETESLERQLVEGSSNPLFAAVQTSEQHVLEAAQEQLGELRRLAGLTAETETLQEATVRATERRQNYRQIGEAAVQDTRRIYELAGKLHVEREGLRSRRMAALEETCALREQEQLSEVNQRKASGNAKLLASTMASITHCSLVQSNEAETTIIDVCDTVRVTLTPTEMRTTLVDGVSDWRRNIVEATGVVTDEPIARHNGAAEHELVGPVRAQLLRAHAGAAELHKLARRYTIIYTDDAADIYFTSRSATAILHVPCKAVAAYPNQCLEEDGRPSVSILKSVGDATRLVAAVQEGCTGVGCFSALCDRVAEEFKRL